MKTGALCWCFFTTFAREFRFIVEFMKILIFFLMKNFLHLEKLGKNETLENGKADQHRGRLYCASRRHILQCPQSL